MLELLGCVTLGIISNLSEPLFLCLVHNRLAKILKMEELALANRYEPAPAHPCRWPVCDTIELKFCTRRNPQWVMARVYAARKFNSMGNDTSCF